MANSANIFDSEEDQNWFKACLATRWTREGIQCVIATEAERLHANILKDVLSANNLPAGSTCNECSTPSIGVLPCPTRGVCKKQKGKCTFHVVPVKACPNHICDVFREEIKSQHRFTCPSWKNTHAERWCSDPLEVVKCFLPEEGYKEIDSLNSTDFNGLVNVFINCKWFESLFTTDLSTDENVCLKARDVTRSLRHNARFKLTEVQLQDLYATLLALLEDLSVDLATKAAFEKISQLKCGSLTISAVDINGVMEDIRSSTAGVVSDVTKQATEAAAGKVRLELDEASQRTEHLLNRLKEASIQMTIDAQRLHVNTIEYVRRKSTEICKDVMEKIYEQTDTIAKELRDQQGCVCKENNYNTMKYDLKRDLLQLYQTKKCYVQISPLNSKQFQKINKFYILPKLRYLQKIEGTTGHETRSGQPLTSFREIFCKDGTQLQNIYIQGEAGSGKSSLCIHLALAWCEAQEPKHAVHSFADIDFLKTFDFLFLVMLRFAGKNETDLVSLVQKQIIEQLTNEIRYPELLIRRIFDTERCVIVIDGLDEWPYSIPLMISRANCTFVTTTRPWKMANVNIQCSYNDLEIVIDGVLDKISLVSNVLSCLNEKRPAGEDRYSGGEPTEIIKYIEDHNLDHLLDFPIVTMQMVCLWFKNGTLGKSRCDIYAKTIEMMLKRALTDKDLESLPQETDGVLPPCFTQKHTHACLENKRFIANLCELAYKTFLSEERTSSIVFDQATVDLYLSDAERKLALETGLLSQYEIESVVEEGSSFSFLHKTFQEFLCAVHVVKCHETNSKAFLDRVSNLLDGADVLDVEELFIFVCGLSKRLGEHLSVVIGNLVKQTTSSDIIRCYQLMILAGYSECIDNGHPEPRLSLLHANLFDKYRDPLSVKQLAQHSRLLDLNAGKMLSLHVFDQSKETQKELERNPGLTSVSLMFNEWAFPNTNKHSFTDLSKCSGIEKLEMNFVETYVKVNAKLRSTLVECTFVQVAPDVENDVLTTLAAGTSVLNKLSIEPSPRSDPAVLLQLLPKMTNLQSLELTGTFIGDRDIFLPSSIRQVKLCFAGMSLRSFRRFVDMLTKMQHSVECEIWRSRRDVYLKSEVVQNDRCEDVREDITEMGTSILKY